MISQRFSKSLIKSLVNSLDRCKAMLVSYKRYVLPEKGEWNEYFCISLGPENEM